MTGFVDNLRRIEEAASDEKGAFTLFALFLREDAPDKWDLVVCAPWIARDKHEGLEYLAGKVQEELKSRDRIRLSRIVIVDNLDPILKPVCVRHGLVELKDNVFYGLKIRHAFIITCEVAEKRDRVPAA